VIARVVFAAMVVAMFALFHATDAATLVVLWLLEEGAGG